VDDFSAKACLKKVEPCHWVTGVCGRGDAEQVVDKAAQGLRVLHGFPLQGIGGHQVAFAV